MKAKALALALIICSAPMFAATVNYSTSGEFTSNTTNSVTNGGETITFSGTTASVTAPTFSSLGTFNVSGSAGSGSFTDNFVLTITQSVPSSGNGTSSTTVSGTVTGNSSTIMLTFAPKTVGIGTVSYTFSPANYGLNNPAANKGDTTIEAFVTDATTQQQNVTPEPGSLGLLGGSLLGLGLIIRRRTAKK